MRTKNSNVGIIAFQDKPRGTNLDAESYETPETRGEKGGDMTLTRRSKIQNLKTNRSVLLHGTPLAMRHLRTEVKDS